MRKIDITEFQQLGAGALNRLFEIFKKHNIRAVIAYGTLLGAVRHEGFIPWDEDIDLLVDYGDCGKIKHLVKNELSEDFRYVDWKMDSDDCMFGVARIYYKKLLKNPHKKSIPMELNIDLFYTAFKKDDPSVYEYMKTGTYIISLCNTWLRYYKNQKSKMTLKILIKRIIGRYDEESDFTPKHRDKAILKNFNKLRKGKDLCIRLYTSDLHLGIYKNFDYNKTTLLKFNGFYLPALQNYKEILENDYGDYLKPVIYYADYRNNFDFYVID